MKYIDAEKMFAEIEKMRKINRKALEAGHIGQDVFHGRAQTLNYLFEFIDSLQQEQPDNEDIDKVAQELYEQLYELKRRNNVPTNLYDKQEIIDLWKVGIVYGRSHPKQEQPEVDLDADVKMEWDSFNKHIAKYSEGTEEVVWLNWLSFVDIANYFYELGLNARKED